MKDLYIKLTTILIILSCCYLEINSSQSTDDISFITTHTFDEELKNNTNLFILFAKIVEFDDIAENDKSLNEFRASHKSAIKNNLPVRFAIVDAANFGEVGKRCGIEVFPSLKLFIDEVPVEYIGGKTSEQFIYFLTAKLAPPSVELLVPEDVESFVSDKEALVYFGVADKSNPKYKLFLKVARKFDDVLFAHCYMFECIQHYEVEWDSMIFFNSKTEKRFKLSDPWTDFMIQNLIEEKYTKVLINFDLWVADYIFTRRQVGMFLFRDKENDNHKIYELMVNRVAKYFKSQMSFVFTDISTNYEVELAKISRVTKANLPTLIIYDARNDEILKYKLKEEFTEANLFNFTKDFFENKLESYYESEEPIHKEKQTHPVLTVVGKTFKEIVMDDKENSTLLYFYSEDCGLCKKAGKLIEKLAILFTNQKIIFCKINAEKNEIQGFEISGLPLLKFFPVSQKDKPIDYPIEQERTLKKIAEFLHREMKKLDISHITDNDDKEFENQYLKIEDKKDDL